MIRSLALRSAMVSNSGTMRSSQDGVGPGVKRAASFRRTATSSMSETSAALEIT